MEQNEEFIPQVQVRDNRKAVRISNMPSNSTEKDLKELARRCPGISEMYLAKDKTTNTFKGLAYFHFRSRKHAERASETLNGLNYNSSILKASCAIR